MQVRRSLHDFFWLTLLFKLYLSLCNATHRVSHYNQFSCEEFYEFIIDFFEADQVPEGKTASKEL